MTLYEPLYGYLSTVPALTALIGTRLRPGYIPQGETMPACAYMAREEYERTLNETPGSATAELFLECHGDTYAQANAVAQALMDALEGHTGAMGSITVQHSLIVSQEHVITEVATDKLRHVLVLTFAVRYSL